MSDRPQAVPAGICGVLDTMSYSQRGNRVTSMNGKSRWAKITVISLLIGVVLGGAITIGRVLYAPGAKRILEGAEDTYARGAAAWQAGDNGSAAARFDEANLKANKAIDTVDKELQDPKNQDGDTLAHLNGLKGQACWVKARAIRDLYFVKAVMEGKPLVESVDSLTGEKFRSVLPIPDREARREAYGCLREAALRLTDDREVQKDALRTEVQMPVLNWDTVEKLARQNLKLNAQDLWATYLLARFEFEQPAADPRTGMAGPTPSNKRSRDRMLQAREYIQRLKEIENYPLWRTLHLEAQIAEWLRDDAAAHAKSTRQEQEDATLRTLLLAPKTGALARANAGEGMEHLYLWDVQGVLGLHAMALDVAVVDSRKPKGTTEKVAGLLRTTLDLCRQLADKNPANAADCASIAVLAMTKAQPALLGDPPSDWNKDFDLVQELTAKAREQKVARTELYEGVIGLFAREAFLEGKRGNKERHAKLSEMASKWIEAGLQTGADAKMTPLQLVELNMLAAETKVIAGEKREKIAPHLEALREAKTPRALALAALLKATLAEREGQIDEARKLLEQVLACNEPDLVLRAHMILGPAFLTLSQPDKALISLQEVANAYKAFDQLSTQEKTWATEFIHSPQDLDLLLVAANAGSALKLRRMAQGMPGKPVPANQLRHFEVTIANLRRGFAKESPQDFQARQIMIGYYLATQRQAEAEKELDELTTYFPHSAAVLRSTVSVVMASRDAAGKPRNADELLKIADRRIEQFIKDHPSDLDGRFFLVEWLTRTGRADAALAYLQAPTNFSDTQNERYRRVLAATLMSVGDRAGSSRILQHLPHDPVTDAMLIQTASGADRDQLLQQALSKHENNGLLFVSQGVVAFEKRDFTGAAEAFRKASDFTRFKPMADRGLQESLFALAQTDPAKARSMVLRMIKQSPEEPLLLLAAAYASLMLDNIGKPDGSADPSRDMASALNAWEKLVIQDQPPMKVAAPLTKAVYWSLASRQDLALAEVTRALTFDPKSEAALRDAIALSFDVDDPSLYPQIQKYLDALKRAQPDDPDVLLWQAQLYERTDRAVEAAQLYEALLRKDAKRSPIYARLVALLDSKGDKAAESEWVRRWRKELPDDVTAWQADVRLLAEAKQFAEARKLVDTFIEEQIAREVKRLSAIKPPPGTDVKELQKNLEANKERARVDLQLGAVFALLQAKAYSEAEAWLKPILDKRPNEEAAMVFLGEAYIGQSAWDKARAVYEKLHALDKNHITAANNLAWLLAKHANKAPEALAIVQEMRKGRFSQKPITGDRIQPNILDTLGLVYTKMNQGASYTEMRETFEAARERHPRDPRMYLYLAHAYAGLLETDKADRLYTIAINLARGDGRKILPAQKCKEVIDEAQAGQKKVKQTAQR
jgi:tetratricopeptide (TPR) repeat protein